MAYSSDPKPLELTALTSLATDDTFIVGDTSDTSEVAKSITKANLITDLSGSYATTAQGALADSASQATGVEDSADVTDTTNVTSSGALMDSEVTNLTQVKAFDTTDYATATQGSTADSAVQPAGTETLTNKRLQPRTNTTTTAPTLAPNLSVASIEYRETQTEALTISAPTGTPVKGETIAMYIDSVGAETLTMNATYKAFGAAFPATTTAGKTLMITTQYNGTDWATLVAELI